jgi:Ca2+-transporting ATPase
VLFLKQFATLLILILVAAAAISALMGEVVEAVSIIVIVILAGVVGFIQEYRAEQALEALRELAAPLATVSRDGRESIIPSRELVPGDVVILKTGDLVPADGRLFESSNLRIDESMITGESEAAEKTTGDLADRQLVIGDRTNMAFAGTMVQYGRGKALVVSTGLRTEFGKIAVLLESTEERKTPLQTSLDRLGKTLGLFAVALAAAMSLFGIYRGYGLTEMFVWGVALAVAVIPEALPAVVTITLALGVRRIAARNALVRRLPAVETLGATTVICTDKTGTLTHNEMTVRKVVTADHTYEVSGAGFAPVGQFLIEGKVVKPDDHPVLVEALKAAILCNDATLRKGADGSWEPLGDPTEAALLVAGVKAGLDHEEMVSTHQRLWEIPFTSERKRMLTAHRQGESVVAYAKGAPEMVLASCTRWATAQGVVPLSEIDRSHLAERARAMAGDALRVLGIAYRSLHANASMDEAEHDLVFSAFVGIQDPPRPEVRDAIRTCEHAGIRPVMITGDHRLTAVAVARELNILKHEEGVLTGEDLGKMSDVELESRIGTVDVFARISPEHKLRIVTGFQNQGHIVAMTGDGVNDAPSLKKADIGIAMGITGTDVSKQASEMILTDDNFATIVNAIREGRSIFQNIRKYLVFLLSGNMGTVFALLIALAANLPLPLDAVQVLFINFIMDGLIAIALGVEPPEPGIMRRKPRKPEEGILNRDSYLAIGVLGTMIGLVTFGVYLVALNAGYSREHAMTVFFVALIAARLYNAINCKSLVESSVGRLFGAASGSHKRHTRNTSLRWTMGITIVLSLAAIYVPVFRVPFSMVPLSMRDLALASAVPVLILVTGEIFKAVRRRKEHWRTGARGGVQQGSV